MGLPAEVLGDKPVLRAARPLAAVDRGYLVYRRRPLSEMTEEQQQKIREAYFETGFVAENCYSFEVFGFYSDLGTAIQEAKDKQGSWMEVTVNSSLPKDLGVYLPHGNPGSKSEEFYERTSPGMEMVPRHDLICAALRMEGLCELASTKL